MTRGIFTLGGLKAIVIALFVCTIATGASAAISGGTGNTEPVSAIPEPSTWVMMIAGFWLVGWRLKRSDGTVVRTTVPAHA